MNIRSFTYYFALYIVGYIIIIISALLVMLDFQRAQYAFLGGVLIMILGRYLTLPKVDDFRAKRLNNMLAVGALLLIASCYFMFSQNNAWVITLFISAIIDLYTALRYPTIKDNNRQA